LNRCGSSKSANKTKDRAVNGTQLTQAGHPSIQIPSQKAILLEYAKKNHFPNPVFFVDDGCSGTNCDRPGFQRMLTETEAEYRNNYREKSL